MVDADRAYKLGMAGYPLEWGSHTDADDTDGSAAPDSPATERYPLEWGAHLDQTIDPAPKLPVFMPVMPTLLGGADPDSLPSGKTVVEPKGPQLVQSLPSVFGRAPFYVPRRPPMPGPARSPATGVPKGSPIEEPEYKIPIPGQSGKEAKDDIPDWARQMGIRPRVGHGEYKKLQKHYDGHYQDPRAVPYEGPFGVPGEDHIAAADIADQGPSQS
ncbi:MAG TPA: hypothetical protein VFB13_08585 [Reyranella sp.]|jgi:hypothetical protein|nr:hypothetical protein [Reyranella sp.]